MPCRVWSLTIVSERFPLNLIFVLFVASWNGNLYYYVPWELKKSLKKKLIKDKYPEILLTFSGFSGFTLEKKKEEFVLVLSSSMLMNEKKGSQ